MLNREISKEIGEQNINDLDFKKYQYKRFKFPFWARLKKNKNRVVLIIDEDLAFDKKKKKYVSGFVNREATHSYKKGFEKVYPNPNPKDSRPMYLKKPNKKAKYEFAPIGTKLNMPKILADRYAKNNKKRV